MKSRILFLLIFVALAISGAALAQDVDNKDFDIGGGGGAGCFTCGYSGNNASCMPLQWDFICEAPGYYSCHLVYGFSSCAVHNAGDGYGYQGPGYCTLSGTCSAALAANKIGSGVADQIAGIDMFLRQSGVITDADLNDFIAITDYSLRGDPYAVAAQKRLAAYRAEFDQLVAHGDFRRELKPGDIPVLPHKPTKAPITTSASAVFIVPLH